MSKCVRDLNYVQIFYGSPMYPYNDPTWIPCGGAAGRPWIPIRILHGSYVGAHRAGSGGAWLGGHGKWCSRLGRQCVLHKNINYNSKAT